MPASATARKRPRKKPADHFHHGGLRDALVDAARSALERDGADGVALRKLAPRLGVTQPAVYRHFASRDALLAAVGLDGYARMTAAVVNAAMAQKTPSEQVRAALRAYVRFAVDNAGWFRLWHSRRWADELKDQASVDTPDMRRQSMAPLLNLLRVAFRDDAPLDDLFRVVWGVGHGLAGLVVERVFVLVETDAERIAAADAAIDLQIDALFARYGRVPP